MRRVLDGERSPVRDFVLLNAAAGLVAWDLLQDPGQAERPMARRLRERLVTVAETIDSGAAAAKLDAWTAATNRR
jgi:anthranilate phosphoribosyltransferase